MEENEEKAYRITFFRRSTDSEGRPRSRNKILVMRTDEYSSHGGIYSMSKAKDFADRVIHDPDSCTENVEDRIAIKENKKKDGIIKFEVEEV